jgi:hypothetical protein
MGSDPLRRRRGERVSDCMEWWRAAGLLISDNLRCGTWCHRYANRFPVIDVGLGLHQVAGLESEPIDDKKRESVGDDRLRAADATEAEIEFLQLIVSGEQGCGP